ncbi:hypothetical protein CK203_044865 [Vitis vinifera]|uniref:Uncharacterized protein n=1 Tax=Vitis vinifera TaxID=29760 RepID=A0A438H0S7_VITVI|nr:hypothetical protein CK203_044865 [Vitis vinifera]
MSSSTASTWTGLIQLCSDYQDREFDDVSPDFLTYHTSGATLGHIPFHLEPLRSTQPGLHFSTLGCHHASPSGRYSEEPLLSHLARFIPFDIVVIPGWSCLWCLDFPRHHSRGVHIRSIMRPIGVILRSSRQIGGASFETRRVPFSHFQWIEICSGISHWGIPPSLSLSGLLCTSSVLNPFLDICESSYWGISPLALFYWGIPPLFGFTVSLVDFSLTFRVIITFRFRRSEPSPCFQFGVQSHNRFSDRHSESHPRLRRSESLSLLSLTFMVIIIIFLVSVFKAIIGFQIDIQSRILSFDVQSHLHHFSVLAFRVIIAFQFWRSEPSLFSVRHSEPSSLLNFGIHSHHYFRFRLPEPSPSSYLGFQSHYRHLA